MTHKIICADGTVEVDLGNEIRKALPHQIAWDVKHNCFTSRLSVENINALVEMYKAQKSQVAAPASAPVSAPAARYVARTNLGVEVLGDNVEELYQNVWGNAEGKFCDAWRIMFSTSKALKEMVKAGIITPVAGPDWFMALK